MELITLAAATTLTEWSERTFWRRFSDGSIKKEARNGKAVVRYAAIAGHMCLTLDADDLLLLEKADDGDPVAQTDLALVFLAQKRPKGALAWLEMAVKQDNANAMHLLARCYIDGRGVDRDENLGLMWLSKAACHGSQLAGAAMQAIRCRLTGL